MTTTFTPGDAVGICGPAACLIAGITLDDPRLPRLWQVLSVGGTDAVDGVLEVLLEDGFATMPSFAIAATSGTATRIVVRHPAVVETTVDGVTTVATSTPGGTWSDVTVEGVSALELRAAADAATTVRLPFHAGMTPASSVRIVIDEAAATAPAPAPTPAPAAKGEAPHTEAPETEVAAEELEPAAEPATGSTDIEAPDEQPAAHDSAATEEGPAEEATPHTAIWKGHEAAAPAQADDQTDDQADDDVAEQSEAQSDTTPEASDEPDGSTVLRPALTQAVPPPAPTIPPAPPAAPPAAPAPSPTPSPAPAAPASGGLIDGVPWLNADWSAASATPAQPKPTFETPSRPVPPPPPTPRRAPAAAPTPAQPAPSQPAPTGAADDEDGDDAPTVLRAELVKELGSAGIVGPSVLAVDCPNGHQTSAHEPTCRLCKAPVGDSQEPRQIPRPPLGALVLASGDRLVLDKDAVLGRAPHEPEGSTERPHLVRVGDNGDISRQHARIMLDGWHVIVRDLGTANGTTLTLPGGSPQQLRANEDYQLEDGAEIGIADVVTLRYEVKP